MKNSEAEKKICIRLAGPVISASAISAAITGAAVEGKMEKTLEDLLKLTTCQTNECMHWYQHVKRETKQLKKGDAIPEGWSVYRDSEYLKSIERETVLDTGQCALEPHLECGGCL